MLYQLYNDKMIYLGTCIYFLALKFNPLVTHHLGMPMNPAMAGYAPMMPNMMQATMPMMQPMPRKHPCCSCCAFLIV